MTELLPGNRVDLLETGDEFFPALAAALDAASRSAHLETYIYRNDRTGIGIAEALIRAASRGVRVRLLVDGFGSANLAAPLRQRLESAGVEVRVFRPERTGFRLRRDRLRRLHRKLCVVDDCVGFCGGINIQDDRDGDDGAAPRFDFAVRVEGPAVADMVKAQWRLWRLVGWATGRLPADPASPVLVRRPMADGVRAAFLVRDNLRYRGNIEDAYLAAIEGARSEIVLCHAYFLPGLRFRRALRDAADRGVRVRLLLQGKSEHRWMHHAMRALYGSMVGAGIEIHDYQAAWLHAKVGVVDRTWATVGSSNLDPFSLLLAREGNVVIVDEGFAARLHRSLEQAIGQRATAVLPEAWARRPLVERLLSWMAYGTARFALGVARARWGQFL